MTRKKQPLQVRSVMSVNMSDKNYMLLHKRMYIVYDDDGYASICLHNDMNYVVSIDVVPDAARDFHLYQMSFSLMLNLFSALCVKFGEMPLKERIL